MSKNNKYTTEIWAAAVGKMEDLLWHEIKVTVTSEQNKIIL